MSFIRCILSLRMHSSTSRKKIYDFTIIGAGIVGLSSAYKLGLAYPDANILVLEKENHVAAHQTGKNSGVIHSGIYYKPESYKAKNCKDGRHQLVEFCKTHGVAIDICGKVIVATHEDEIRRLENIYRRGLENEIEGIEMIDSGALAAIEPHAAGVAAIHVPCAGIVDFKGVCEKLAGLITLAKGEVLFSHPVKNISEHADGVYITAGDSVFTSRFVINCAGLQSDLVAKLAGIKTPVHIVPFKGEYFELKPEAEYLVNNLIYPLPNPDFPFLGVHFTRMVLGGIECGPNAVFSFKREGYGKMEFSVKDTIETLKFPGFWKMARQH